MFMTVAALALAGCVTPQEYNSTIPAGAVSKMQVEALWGATGTKVPNGSVTSLYPLPQHALNPKRTVWFTYQACTLGDSVLVIYWKPDPDTGTRNWMFMDYREA